MISVSLKLKEKQHKLLEALSKQTQIPKSALIRKGIELLLRQAQEDIISADLKQEIDTMLKEDKKLLDKLAKA